MFLYATKRSGSFRAHRRGEGIAEAVRCVTWGAKRGGRLLSVSRFRVKGGNEAGCVFREPFTFIASTQGLGMGEPRFEQDSSTSGHGKGPGLKRNA